MFILNNKYVQATSTLHCFLLIIRQTHLEGILYSAYLHLASSSRYVNPN